jgi:hypothetical protein
VLSCQTRLMLQLRLPYQPQLMHLSRPANIRQSLLVAPLLFFRATFFSGERRAITAQALRHSG